MSDDEIRTVTLSEAYGMSKDERLQHAYTCLHQCIIMAVTFVAEELAEELDGGKTFHEETVKAMDALQKMVAIR